jgi:uncharacterized integral membrane protein (TIGR00697 family)
MINELIFLLQILLITLFSLGSLRLGKQALVAFITLQPILANLFVLKQITLFGLTATPSDAFAVGGVLGLNLLQEYYGRDLARKTIWISFFLLIFYGILSQVHLAFIANIDDIMNTHYIAILGIMPRLLIASLLTYFIVLQIDSFLYAKFKIYFHDKHIIFRNYASIAISQFIDTVLFSFLGLYGVLPNLLHIILISYIIKLCTIAIATPFVGFSKIIFEEN